jgi:subtilisin family serine protease
MSRFLVNSILKASAALSAMAFVTACGGASSSGVSSTPAPPVSTVANTVSPPPPPPPPVAVTPSSVDFNTAEYSRSNGAVQAKAITAYAAGASGAGIVTAVIDSGIASANSEFVGRIHAASTDLAGNRGIIDEDGHGTYVSSILAGARNAIGAHGVAFGATLLVARTDTPGSCSAGGADTECSHDDNVIARGIDLAVSNQARVINISLGGAPANNVLRSAIGRATAAGTIIVISAGNKGIDDPQAAVNPDSLAQIASDPLARNLVIIAGALDASNVALANFSNKAGNGSVHYLGALGVRIRAIDQNGGSVLVSGTSFAAPIVSGAVALLAQAFPTLTGAQIVDLLFRSATDLGASGVDGEFGQGALDIARAFQPIGQTAMAGTAQKIALVAQDTKLSPAMGDAAVTGLSTVVLDEYARAFDVELGGTVRRAAIAPRLGAALGIGARGLSGTAGPVAVSLSIVPRNADVVTRNIHLAREERARAIAGSVIARLDGKTRVALGISRSAATLVSQLSGKGSVGFLASDSAGTGLGFEARPGPAFALGYDVAGFEISTTAETGQIERHDRSFIPETPDRYALMSIGAERRMGALGLSARATYVSEGNTLLGARFDGFLGANGARTWFADVSADVALGSDWQASAALRQGFTRIGAGGARLGTDHIRSSSWSFDVSKSHLFDPSDRFAFRIAQPLRVTGGGFDVTLARSYDYATTLTTFGTQRVNLTPKGREIDVEALYAREMAGGLLSANLYFRRDPGNFATAPGDYGAAIRFTLGL